ncbi:glycosyltransferase [Vibrio sp. L5-1]|uniref:glycosyltransferase n=1 Tax=Vibrio sp. L5-1 TaxID=2912254 RepID=UPI001F25500E|nr:glycosyltransferase [Vibrio sp. L5-1]MCF7497148.1 glycosyltransferase [Vibrio sp. L5-1]
MKKKILFVVSNLRRTGPVNQLSYIISHLDLDKYECRVLTLSPEPVDSKFESYISQGIIVDTLSLTRVQSVLFGSSKLSQYVNNYSPDIIQTQGVRADSLGCALKNKIPWVTTSRNFPIEDYPSKFGKFKGTLMAKKHIKVLAQCKYLVSCSNAIASKLKNVGITSTIISNGVPPSCLPIIENMDTATIKLITVGSLIPRKNMEYLVRLSNKLDELNLQHEFIVLGDGPLLNELKMLANGRMKFIGNVNNVEDYLSSSNVFLSSSLSEGLPNTVLEAISFGVPVFLSNIPPHREIADKLPENSSYIFSLSTPPETLAIEFISNINMICSVDRGELADVANSKFGAKAMSEKYQKIYEASVNE